MCSNLQENSQHTLLKLIVAGTTQDIQFCILSIVMFVFIKNIRIQYVFDEFNDDKDRCTRPNGGDGASLFFSIYNKNDDVTRASDIVAKTEPLSVETKNLHNSK